MSDPLLKEMQSIAKRMVKAQFAEPWQFRVEIEDAPKDWDLLCKEVSQTPYELEHAQQRIGAHYLSYLNGVQSVVVTMTMRDNEDGEIFEWFKEWVDSIVNPDGTWNVPSEYLKTLKLHRLSHAGKASVRQELRVQPLTMGELTETVDRTGALLEFPISVVEFRGRSTEY